MQIDNHAGSTKLLWVDLEMTGLDPAKHVIIEVAAQVTDWDFTVLGTYEAIISHPDDVLNDAHEVAKLPVQARQRRQQCSIVSLVQADRRFVEHVEHAGEV